MRIGVGTITVTYIVVTVLAFLGMLEVWHVALSGLIVGAYWSSENPVRRTLICAAVGTARTGTAMSFDWATINGMRLAGPVAGGALYAAYGMGAACALGAACFACAMVLALGAAPEERPAVAAGRRLRDDILSNLSLVRGNPAVQGVLGITLGLNFFGFTYSSMVPVIGKEVLHAAPADVGFLASTEGFGAMLGAVILTAFIRPRWFGRVFLIGSFGVALGALGFGLSQYYVLSVATLVCAGIGMSWFAAMQSTQVLAHAPADSRPGVMGVLTTTIGLGQVGALLMGWLATQFGAPHAVVISALCGVLTLVFCAWRWPVVWRATA
jgi:predicted MFS family arabinose efflux permease